MGIRFVYPNEAAAEPTVFQPSRAPRWPKQNPKSYPMQAVARTAGGSKIVHDFGNSERRWPLVFNGLSQSDYEEAETFFDTVKGAGKTFEFIDLDGNTFTVRWVNSFLLQKDPVGSGGGTYSGAIELAEEI